MEQVTRNEEGVAIIKCSRIDGSGDGFALVDDDKWHELAQYKWEMDYAGYAFSLDERDGVRIGSMHRYLLPKEEGSKLVVDHKNGVRHDARLANLQLITQSDNSQKKKKKEGATSTHRGVCKVKGGRYWTASVTKDGKAVSVSFTTEVQAAMAYNMIAKHLYGDKAAINPNISAEDHLAHKDAVSERVNTALLRNAVAKRVASGSAAEYEEDEAVVVSAADGAASGSQQTAKDFIGVSKVMDGVWVATISTKGETLSECFKTEVQAAMVFTEFAKHFYGEHARELNEIGAADMLAHGDIVRSRVNASRVAAGQAPAAPVVVVPPPPVQAAAPAGTSQPLPPQITEQQCAAPRSDPPGVKKYIGVSKAPADMPPGWHAHATQGGRTLSAAFDTEVQADCA